MVCSGVPFRVNRCLFAPQSRALHGDVAQRIVKSRKFRLAKIENLGSKTPGTRSRLNKHEFRRVVESFPHFCELPRQETGKDGMYVSAGVVVRETPGLRFAVIAMDRMIETFAHVVRERKGALATSSVGKYSCD